MGELSPGVEAAMIGKRVQFDDETWQALGLLARDSMKDFQELADQGSAQLFQFYPNFERMITPNIIQELRGGVDLVIVPSSREAGQFMDEIGRP
jgi:hypothetical protein